jgi:hypothetical protein
MDLRQYGPWALIAGASQGTQIVVAFDPMASDQSDDRFWWKKAGRRLVLDARRS